MAAISEELIEKMVRGRGAGRRSPEESLKLLIQLRRAFPQLGTAEVPRFLKVAENICYPQGSLLTTQGEKNEFLWLLLSGSLSVIVDSQMVAQLSEGALIGEAVQRTQQIETQSVLKALMPAVCCVFSALARRGVSKSSL